MPCGWDCLRSGRPLAGPSTVPQPRYDVRVRDGMVEIRCVPEPGDARLRALGAELEAMLETERTSRARRAFRTLKIRLLEGR